MPEEIVELNGAPHPRRSLYQERHQFWQQVMQDYDDSGIIAKVFCEERRLRYEEFKRWRYRLNKEARLGIEPLSLIEVKIAEAPVKSTLALQIGRQLRIELASDFNEAILQKLLRVVGV